MSKVVNVILTGGVGSRLWPLSRASRPKQYIPLFRDKSLFYLTIKRNVHLTDETIIVGSHNNINHAKNIIKNLRIKNPIYIEETIPKNTAPAIAFAAFASDSEDILLVTPSDHIISDDINYYNSVKTAIEIAKKDYLVTFGIKPTKPSTAYGYIKADGEVVKSFYEKPDEEMANIFFNESKYFWNSGMFCFKAKTYLNELKNYSPEVFRRSKIAWDKSNNGKLEHNSSELIPDISVDYAVMEKSRNLRVVKSNFYWNDLGSYDSIYEYFILNGYKTDSRGNMVIGSNKHTEFIGLEKCIYIHTDDAILIIHKDHSQKVKELYELLKVTNEELI